MSNKPTIEQKEQLHVHFASKTAKRPASQTANPEAVKCRRRIEELEENKRLNQELYFH